MFSSWFNRITLSTYLEWNDFNICNNSNKKFLTINDIKLLSNDYKSYYIKKWIINNDIESISKFITENADAKIDDITDNYGKTSLMIACEYNIQKFEGSVQNPTIIKTLIDAGSDVNAIDNDGSTALIYACAHKDPNVKVIQILLDNGANINMRNTADNSALSFCYFNTDKHLEIAKILLNAGSEYDNIHHSYMPKLMQILFPLKDEENKKIILELRNEISELKKEIEK